MENPESTIDIDKEGTQINNSTFGSTISTILKPRNLEPGPDEEDFHKNVYEDAIISLYYQLLAQKKILQDVKRQARSPQEFQRTLTDKFEDTPDKNLPS